MNDSMKAAQHHGCGFVQIKRHNNKRLRLIGDHSPRGEEGKNKINYSNNKCYNPWYQVQQSSWGELPEDLLQLIFDRLSLGEYATFGAVCRTWRSLDVERKQACLASQPPLLFMKKISAKRSCYFLNIFGGRGDADSKTVLPYANSIYCDTFCCGYLIAYVLKMHQLWLLNPITRNLYRFPYAKYPLHRVIIASSSIRGRGKGRPWPYSTDDLVIVGVGMSQEYVNCYRSRDAKWTARTYGSECGEIVDIVNFKGKIYFLTKSAGFGIINLPTTTTSQSQDQDDVLVRLEVEKGSNPPPTASLDGYYLELVASDEQLMMVVFLNLKVVSVYELDLSKMEWRRVEDSLGDGDQAIFTGNLNSLIKSSALVKNVSSWGGRSNCVYSLDAKGNCSVYSLDGKVLQTFPAPTYLSPVSIPVWYFPHQCNTYGTIDSLYED